MELLIAVGVLILLVMLIGFCVAISSPSSNKCPNCDVDLVERGSTGIAGLTTWLSCTKCRYTR